MKKKTTAPVQGGTADETAVNEFARLALELAILNPERLLALMDELMPKRDPGSRRSHIPNKKR